MNRIEFYLKLDKYKAEQKAIEEEKNKGEVLMHYGTKGQKWGVRKWQNADGTFNEAGKERYFGSSKKSSGGSDDQKIGGLWKDVTARTFFNITTEGKMKHIKKHSDYFDIDDLTDDEILKVIRRTPSRYNPYDTEAYADRINRNLHNYKVDKEIKEFAESRKDLEKLEELNSKKLSKGDKVELNKQEDELKDIEKLPEKLNNEAKKVREDGSDDLADTYEKAAKEIKIGNYFTKNAQTKEEKKEIKDACNHAMSSSRRAIPLGYRLFLGWGPIGIMSFNITKKAVNALDLGAKWKANELTASDWRKIDQKIMETYPKKFTKVTAVNPDTGEMEEMWDHKSKFEWQKAK